MTSDSVSTPATYTWKFGERPQTYTSRFHYTALGPEPGLASWDFLRQTNGRRPRRPAGPAGASRYLDFVQEVQQGLVVAGDGLGALHQALALVQPGLQLLVLLPVALQLLPAVLEPAPGTRVGTNT